MLCLVTHSCLTLCDPVDCSPPGSSVHGILQARILEWVAISSSRGSSRPRDRTCISCLAGGFLPTEPPGKPFAVSASIGKHATSWNRGAGRGHRGRQELRVEFEGVSSASACGAEDEVIKKLVLLLTPSRCSWGTSIVVQWLGIHACNAGGLGSIPVDEAEGKMVFDFLDTGSRETTQESVDSQTSAQLMGSGANATGQTHWTHPCSFFFWLGHLRSGTR